MKTCPWRRFAAAVLMTAGIALVCLCFTAPSPATAADDGAVLATIGETTITRAEFDAEVAGLPENYRLMAAEPAVQKEFLDSLVTRNVLFQTARKKGVLEEPAIRRQIDEFTRKLAVSTLLEREVEQQVAKISGEEARKYYTAHPDEFRQGSQVRARHILVADRREAEKLRAHLQDGKADFAALAREHSTCPSAERGGDLGFFSRDRMDKPFTDVAFALKPGELSNVVETRFGFHLIRVEETRAARQQEFDEVEEMLTERLRMERKNRLFTELVDRLKKELVVETHPERLDR